MSVYPNGEDLQWLLEVSMRLSLGREGCSLPLMSWRRDCVWKARLPRAVKFKRNIQNIHIF